MKFHGIEMKGDFIVEKLSTTPTWTSSDEGRMIYVNDDDVLKLGTDSEWINIGSGSSSSGDTYYTLPESNGDTLYDDCSNISLWTDGDSGTGSSTQITYDDKSSFKLDTGSTAGSGNDCTRNINVGSLPNMLYFNIKMNHTALGSHADQDIFQLWIDVSTTQRIQFSFSTDGFRTFDSGWNDDESGISVDTNVWVEWLFIIDLLNKKLTIYKDKVKVKENITWDYWTSTGLTAGDVWLFQGGNTTTNRITYVDQVKVGSAFTKVSQNDLAGMTKFGINNTPYTPAGYIAGGNTGTAISTIDKLTFSNDNCDSISSHLSSLRYSPVGFNSSISGYVAGGRLIGGNSYSTIDKLTFSNDNCNSITSNLSTARYGLSGFNSTSSGYAAGGSSSANISTIDKLTFSNDNCDSINSGLSSAISTSSGFNSSSAGYVTGGYSGDYVSTIDKLTFNNDNNSSINSGLSSARYGTAGFNSISSGYNAGGYTGAYVSTIDKLTFNNDNNSSINSGLSSARDYVSGFNSTSAGYVTGGYTGAYVSTIDKLTFSDDTRSVLTSGLSSNRSGSAGFNTL